MKTIALVFATAAIWMWGAVALCQTPAENGDVDPVTTELTVVEVNHRPVSELGQILYSILYDRFPGSPSPRTGPAGVIEDTTGNRLIFALPKEEVAVLREMVGILDQPQPTVTIDLIEATVMRDAADEIRTAETAALQKAIEQLAKQGRLKVIDTMHFSVEDKKEAMIQVGSRAPMVTGTRGTPRGGQTAKAYTYMDVGTIFKVTPRVGDNAVSLDFAFEKSELVPPAQDSDEPLSTVKTTTQSTVRILRDQSVVVGGMRMGPDGRPIHWKLIISATVD